MAQMRCYLYCASSWPDYERRAPKDKRMDRSLKTSGMHLLSGAESGAESALQGSRVVESPTVSIPIRGRKPPTEEHVVATAVDLRTKTAAGSAYDTRRAGGLFFFCRSTLGWLLICFCLDVGQFPTDYLTLPSTTTPSSKTRTWYFRLF